MESYNNVGMNQQMPMKWYKFIIYFQLFASALMYLFSGISYLSELWNRTLESALWGTKWKVLCVVMAVIAFVIMACMLYTRHCLTMYKKKAPRKYLCCLVLALLYAVVYMIGIFLITGKNTFSAMDLLTLTETGILIVLNFVYFKKREHLFIY